MYSIISLLDRGATTTTACYNTLVGILSCDYNNVLFFGHWRWMVRETIPKFLLPSLQNTLNFTNPNCSSSPVNLTIITTNTITVQCRPLHWWQGSVTDHHTRIWTKPTGMHMRSIVSRVVFVGILQTQIIKNLFFGPNLVYHHRSSFFWWGLGRRSSRGNNTVIDHRQQIHNHPHPVQNSFTKGIRRLCRYCYFRLLLLQQQLILFQQSINGQQTSPER